MKDSAVHPSVHIRGRLVKTQARGPPYPQEPVTEMGRQDSCPGDRMGEVYNSSQRSADHHHQKLQGAGESAGLEEEAGALYYEGHGRQWYTIYSELLLCNQNRPAFQSWLCHFPKWMRVEPQTSIPRGSSDSPLTMGVLTVLASEGFCGLNDTMQEAWSRASPRDLSNLAVCLEAGGTCWCIVRC